MAYEAKIQGFSTLDRKILLTDPIAVSKSKILLAESKFEEEPLIEPVVGPWRINANYTEYNMQKFFLEIDKITADGVFSASNTPPASLTMSAAMTFGSIFYTYDELEVHHPYSWSPICSLSVSTTSGSNPVRPQITFSHMTVPLFPPVNPSDGYDFVNGVAYTAYYPGLISQIGFGWYYAMSAATTASLSLDVEVTKICLNVRNVRSGYG